MSALIRRPTQADKEQWEALYRKYLEFYNTSFTNENIELTWNRLTKSSEIQGFVAEENGVILGFTHFHYQISTWTPTFACYLEDLFVSENARNKGIARSLIAEVEKQTKIDGGTEIFWITKRSNEVAQGLYNQVSTLTDFIYYQSKFK
jgi:ribosomal protein S18 acetylase RimI-like enzyme